ncbi:MAG TPA: DeoR/GlpR transcriptional regulator [Clostridiales bacterium]|nr:DeoR/GlpR transcriptional regulator [Clostridiales bacterium]
MFALERQKKIIDTLKSDGAVWVSKLSEELGVTEETVRRDLEKLEKQELLLRTHGGAIPIDEGNYEMSLEKRKSLNADAKIRLAKEAANHIASGDTIFLDASTTTFYIAKELKVMKDVTIITNSIRVVNELAGLPSLKVIGVGGFVSNNQSFVGSQAQRAISENYFANKMFFSSRGVTINAGILESNDYECEIKQCMLKNSEKKYYIFDKSKIGRVGFAKLAQLEDIDCFITEKDIDERYVKALRELDTRFIEV